MKEEYVLYLDESEFPNTSSFVIGGFAIKKSLIPKINEDMAAIKELLWTNEYIAANNPTLHCTEFQKVYVFRGKKIISGVRDEYVELHKKSKDEIEKNYVQLYGRLAKTLKDNNATIFSCVIKMKQLRELFILDKSHDGSHLIDDRYNIALQRIIENYTHFLSVVDGYGDVVYESRNSIGENSSKSPDIRLINDYHRVQANNKGIIYTNSKIIQDRNRSFQTCSKEDSIAGLQIADFISYNINLFKNNDAAATDFMKLLHRLSYNGGRTIEEKDQRSFWGMNVLPSYLEMEGLITENKTLKNSYKKLKKEKNKVLQKNEKLEEKIKTLEQEIAGYKARIQELSGQDNK